MLIKEMKEREEIAAYFYVNAVSSESTVGEKPKPYLMFQLESLQSEKVTAKSWNGKGRPLLIDDYPLNTVVFVEGVTRKWKNNIEITIKAIRNATQSEIEENRIVRASVDKNDPIHSFSQMIATIKNKELQYICEYCLTTLAAKVEETELQISLLKYQQLDCLLSHVGKQAPGIDIDILRSALLINELIFYENTKSDRDLLGPAVIGADKISEAAFFGGFSLSSSSIVKLKHVIVSINQETNCQSTLESKTARLILDFYRQLETLLS